MFEIKEKDGILYLGKHKTESDWGGVNIVNKTL